MKKEYYEIEIAGLVRRLPLCPLNDKLNIAAFVIFGDVELTEACASELLARAPEHDILITAESKGIPLVYAMARQNNAAKYLVARKAPKLYMRNIHTTSVRSITTPGMQTLCIDQDDAELMRGRNVLLVDDVISTGESLRALRQLVEEAGGIVVGSMAVLAEGAAQGRDDLVYLESLPLFDENGDPIAE